MHRNRCPFVLVALSLALAGLPVAGAESLLEVDLRRATAGQAVEVVENSAGTRFAGPTRLEVSGQDSVTVEDDFSAGGATLSGRCLVIKYRGEGGKLIVAFERPKENALVNRPFALEFDLLISKEQLWTDHNALAVRILGPNLIWGELIFQPQRQYRVGLRTRVGEQNWSYSEPDIWKPNRVQSVKISYSPETDALEAFLGGELVASASLADMPGDERLLTGFSFMQGSGSSEYWEAAVTNIRLSKP
jgi:hypothetical protein